jgi:hypothetical protein
MQERVLASTLTLPPEAAREKSEEFPYALVKDELYKLYFEIYNHPNEEKKSMLRAVKS